MTKSCSNLNRETQGKNKEFSAFVLSLKDLFVLLNVTG